MSALNDLLASHDEANEEIQTILDAAKAEDRDLTAEEEVRSDELLTTLDEIAPRIDEERKKEKRGRRLQEARALAGISKKADVEVVAEPMVYGEDSPNSYYADVIRWQGGPQWKFHSEAGQRLAEWGHQIERELANGSKQSKRIESELRELKRGENAAEAINVVKEARDRGRVSLEEKRSIASGGGASATAASGGSSFVTPVFYVSDYAPWREYGRAFADAVHHEPLPPYGMNVYIPAVQGPAGVASQTEGSGINETDPSFGYLTGALTTEAGQVTVSQQLLDRAGPNFQFDRMIYDQLRRDYAPKVDTYVLNAALSSPQTQNWTGNGNAFDLTTTSGAGGFYGQVSKAKAAIRTYAGTVLNPTHLFLQPARWEFIAAWADSSGKNMVVPNYAGPYNAAAAGNSTGDEGIEGNTQYRLNGLPVYQDANIPNNGTTSQDQAIVGCLDEVWLFEGTPTTRTLPQTLGQNLQTILQLYNYLTVVVRYPKGIVAITGTGLGTISYTN